MKRFLFLLFMLCVVLALPQATGQQLVTFDSVVTGVANTDTPDEDGDLPSYFVLQANEATNISGWYLTDSAVATTKWRIPDGYFMEAGQKLKIFLPDGSIAWLNSSSELSYQKEFSESMRNIFLSGEAYFEVIKDSSRPFVVHSGPLAITATGTSFNIDAFNHNKIIFIADI